MNTLKIIPKQGLKEVSSIRSGGEAEMIFRPSSSGLKDNMKCSNITVLNAQIIRSFLDLSNSHKTSVAVFSSPCPELQSLDYSLSM